MFSYSEIAECFEMGRAKLVYAVNFGRAFYLHNNLTENIEK